MKRPALIDTASLFMATLEQGPAEFGRMMLAVLRSNSGPSWFRPERDAGERLSPHEWIIVRTRIFERDGYACSYCPQVGGLLECDHVIPLARGGSNDDGNLATACRLCNRSKGAKLLSEWRS